MPEVTENQTIRLRTADVDASQSSSPGAVLACLEDVRFALFRRIRALDTVTRQVARAQTLCFHERFAANAPVRVEVSLSRLGRTSFTTHHRIFEVDADRPLATSLVTMVTLDRAGRPTPAPVGLTDWVRPTEASPAPALPEQLPGDAWSHHFRARPSDENRGAHVSHTRMVDYLEDARRLCALDGGFGVDSELASEPCRSLSVSYEAEAHAGQALVVSTWPAREPRGFDAQVRAEQGAVLARARMVV